MSLLPANATKLELAVDHVQAVRISGVPVDIRDLWNPETCPGALLPWLAWTLSVDKWDTAWSETQKRQVIKNSIAIHRYKGTRAALEGALESLGFAVEVEEWWQTDPAGTPGTFDLIVQIPGGYAVDAAAYSLVESIALANKNTRSHLGNITLTTLGVAQAPTCSAAAIAGCNTTVYPVGMIGIGDDV